ncbi:MAG: hypothetical protein A2430_01905 [Candidatus Liptonbacteria bacterium RIFOXYC1_FULL_36_8]|uniref:Uncharacterized protein n=2 Tax=Candidatus Liptoniibacteriota TaxID=1817909 RepID=A0A1G2CPC3_9BACT|nr:MAG: hypothetical protein A2390_02590 [Candidatus Liptonbacteria bacterium RIFOXYB1_FULL_36_10]OGZ03485.1 MAG: hypothetical protein A2430_01905 [Candidatus Liptonbacteria bacterium RIFOXYC1_FULL_36_8]
MSRRASWLGSLLEQLARAQAAIFRWKKLTAVFKIISRYNHYFFSYKKTKLPRGNYLITNHSPKKHPESSLKNKKYILKILAVKFQKN